MSTIQQNRIQNSYRIGSRLLALSLLFVLSGCQWVAESYLGLNMQPGMDEADFTPGLNVFGALKAGETLDTINCYFEIQEVKFLGSTFENFSVEDAEIELQCTRTDGTLETYHLTHRENGLYMHANLDINPGEHWAFTCTADTFTVRSECVIPNTPMVQNVSLQSNGVQFEIGHDTTAFMYDVYLISGEKVQYNRVVALQTGNTSIQLKTTWTPTAGSTTLYVLAYDRQFERYFSTSSLFFKPNAYRPPFTVVEGGYGVFGGISSAKVGL